MAKRRRGPRGGRAPKPSRLPRTAALVGVGSAALAATLLGCGPSKGPGGPPPQVAPNPNDPNLYAPPPQAQPPQQDETPPPPQIPDEPQQPPPQPAPQAGMPVPPQPAPQSGPVPPQAAKAPQVRRAPQINKAPQPRPPQPKEAGEGYSAPATPPVLVDPFDTLLDPVHRKR